MLGSKLVKKYLVYVTFTIDELPSILQILTFPTILGALLKSYIITQVVVPIVIFILLYTYLFYRFFKYINAKPLPYHRALNKSEKSKLITLSLFTGILSISIAGLTSLFGEILYYSVK